MPDNQLGIEHLKQALTFVNDFRNQIAQTKKFNFLSAIGFVDELIELGGVIGSWKDIVAEWKDKTPAELTELYQFAKDKFHLPNEKVQAFVDKSFTWVLLTLELVEDARNLKK